MALDFNENDLINIKANNFDKLEHIFETLDNENEFEIQTNSGIEGHAVLWVHLLYW